MCAGSGHLRPVTTGGRSGVAINAAMDPIPKPANAGDLGIHSDSSAGILDGQ